MSAIRNLHTRQLIPDKGKRLTLPKYRLLRQFTYRREDGVRFPTGPVAESCGAERLEDPCCCKAAPTRVCSRVTDVPSEAVARTASVAAAPQTNKKAKPASQLINPEPDEACTSPPEADGPWHVKAGLESNCTVDSWAQVARSTTKRGHSRQERR